MGPPWIFSAEVGAPEIKAAIAIVAAVIVNWRMDASLERIAYTGCV